MCFLVRVCLSEEFWFDGNIAAPAGGTLGSLCWYRLPVLGVFLECVGYLVIIGVVARVVVVPPPKGTLSYPWGVRLLACCF